MSNAAAGSWGFTTDASSWGYTTDASSWGFTSSAGKSWSFTAGSWS